MPRTKYLAEMKRNHASEHLNYAYNSTRCTYQHKSAFSKSVRKRGIWQSWGTGDDCHNRDPRECDRENNTKDQSLHPCGWKSRQTVITHTHNIRMPASDTQGLVRKHECDDGYLPFNIPWITICSLEKVRSATHFSRSEAKRLARTKAIAPPMECPWTKMSGGFTPRSLRRYLGHN